MLRDIFIKVVRFNCKNLKPTKEKDLKATAPDIWYFKVTNTVRSCEGGDGTRVDSVQCSQALPSRLDKVSVVANDEGEAAAREMFPLVSFCASTKISYLSGVRFLGFGFF